MNSVFLILTLTALYLVVETLHYTITCRRAQRQDAAHDARLLRSRLEAITRHS